MDVKDGRAVPNFIQAAMEGRPLKVYGDGSATRCFQFAKDCVEGLEALMNSDYDSPVNIGSDHETTVGDIANMISKLVADKLVRNTPPQVRFLPKRQDDPVQRKPDIALAQKILGWRSKVTLEQGLSLTVDWFIENGKPGVDGVNGVQ